MEEKNTDNFEKDLLDSDLIENDEWIKSIQTMRKKNGKWDKQKKILIYFLSFLLIIVVIFFNINYFFKLSLKEWKLTDFQKKYMGFVESNIIDKLIKNNSKNWSIKQFDNKSKNIKVRLNNMKSYVNDMSIIFYKKQREKKKFTSTEFDLFNNILKKIKSNQEFLVKYKFLPKDLSKLIKDIKMMPILLTLNSIKIYMIDYVYIKTWRFNDEILSSIISNSLILNNFTVNKTELEISLIEDIKKMRESWIILYLKNIKFNYMYDKWDNLMNNYFVNKFYENFNDILNKRVKKLWLDKSTRKKFIVSYISLIRDIYDKTNKLFENQDINQLPINVDLLSYDPKSQTLSFNVDIMLQDKYNAKTSVIKIATDLVSLLRESRLIIGSNIKMNDIKVQKVSELIWGSKVTFDKTSLLFNTSVQSDANVEVTDIEK